MKPQTFSNYIFSIVVYFISIQTFANEIPFSVGEKLSYIGNYKVLGISTVLGSFDIEVVSRTQSPDHKDFYYQFKANGTTAQKLASIHPIKREVLSIWSELNQSSLKYQTHEIDRSEIKNETEDFLYSEKNCKLNLEINKKNKLTKKAVNQNHPLTEFSQDNLSFLYSLRTLNLPTSTQGALTFPIVYDCESWKITVNFIKTTDVWFNETLTSASIYSLTNFSPTGDEDSTFNVWILNTHQRPIVKFEGSISVGSVSATLVGTKFD